MLGSSRVAAELAASREGLGSMSEMRDECVKHQISSGELLDSLIQARLRSNFAFRYKTDGFSTTLEIGGLGTCPSSFRNSKP
jgi:hypothetical protein